MSGIWVVEPTDTNPDIASQVLWEDVRWVDGWVTEVKHTQILLLFSGSVNLYYTTGLLLPLMAGRVFLVCIGCCGIALAFVTLFGRKSGHWEWDKMHHL